MKTLNRTNFPGNKYPEKIIQFGEGNFLRAFVDWVIDGLNTSTDFNSGVTIVRPIDTPQPKLDSQDGLYTSVVRGINELGQKVVDTKIIRSVNKELLAYGEFDKIIESFENPELEWVFSNTTEAGIRFEASDNLSDMPPSTFPGKLTKLLFHRFKYFNASPDKGMILIPCELNENNGPLLKSCIEKYAHHWDLGKDFLNWFESSNTVCSTLVDRIVTGYPRDEISELQEKLGYEDKFLVTSEYFHLFVIEGPEFLKEKLKLSKVNLNVEIVDDIKPYKEQKVSILNGAHTAMVPVSFLSGNKTVKESMDDEIIFSFISNMIKDEVIPTLSLNKDRLEDFSQNVFKRFKNPYIKHELSAIALNSISKFHTRLLPSLTHYIEKFNEVPKNIAFSLACLILFYRGTFRDIKTPVKDSTEIEQFFKENDSLFENDLEELANKTLANQSFWGCDLNQYIGLKETVYLFMQEINKNGTVSTIQKFELASERV
ncbi:altronate oxidoreductase [Paraphotobacterium marinum]|uniref:Altronate oxidoreductase n=1 Tax=Paraphotobacterium marinum TaxID=1755811 RepID=A0A220VE25_9GAMM|nr:tagaturonate reductase [Paraphotobacterium marinum]ASK78668.1 altronate oxidoreductase [Paraphotobacterium marinum]